MHPLDGCDGIVCWINNWPECPLEVIELRSVIRDRVIARDRKSNTYHGGTETRRKEEIVCRRSAEMNADQKISPRSAETRRKAESLTTDQERSGDRA
jgi:hypothetical protein